MLKKILILNLLTMLIFSGCEKKDPIETLFRKAEKLEPGILTTVSQISQYRSIYERILIEAPKSKFAPLACYKLGKLNEIFGHWEQATEYYQKLLAHYPDHSICADGLFNLARIYELQLDDVTRAMESYQQLVTFYSDSPVVIKAYLRLGQLSSQMGRWSDAVTYFQTVIDKYPEHEICDDIYFRLGDIFQNKLEDTGKAVQMYRLLLKKYPVSSWSEYARLRLAEMDKGGL